MCNEIQAKTEKTRVTDTLGSQIASEYGIPETKEKKDFRIILEKNFPADQTPIEIMNHQEVVLLEHMKVQKSVIDKILQDQQSGRKLFYSGHNEGDENEKRSNQRTNLKTITPSE